MGCCLVGDTDPVSVGACTGAANGCRATGMVGTGAVTDCGMGELDEGTTGCLIAGGACTCGTTGASLT